MKPTATPQSCTHSSTLGSGPRGPGAWRRAWRNAADALSRRLWFLEGQGLVAQAQRRTGLCQFDQPALEPALSVLLQSLENEAALHPLGRFLLRSHLRSLLETRLRLAQFWAQTQMDALPLEQPLFIIGMPRSGSTFLHELLAQDPQNRAPRVWEVMYPVPAAGPEQGRRSRIRKAAACLWWFRRLAPGADSVYPMRAQTPHECVAIHSYTFLSQEFLSTCRIPSYEALLLQADLGPVYRWQRRFLQHLQSGQPSRRWVLKSPDHVYGLAQLFSAFPDAWVIQTHRDPLEVLRSSTELTRVLQGLYAWPQDPAQVRAREARLLAEGTERSLQFRDQHPELAHRFIDVKYTELVTQPLALITRIYQQLGTQLSAQATTRIQTLASARSRYRPRPAHTRTPRLRTELLAEARRFERYCSRFDLPCRAQPKPHS